MARPKKSRELDPWPQRLRFMELVDTKIASGVSIEEIAEHLGLLSTHSLSIGYRHDFGRTPKRSVMEKAAGYFDVPLWEIYGPKPNPEEDAYRIGLDIARTAQGGGKPATELTREEIIHMGNIAIDTAKFMLSNK